MKNNRAFFEDMFIIAIIIAIIYGIYSMFSSDEKIVAKELNPIVVLKDINATPKEASKIIISKEENNISMSKDINTSINLKKKIQKKEDTKKEIVPKVTKEVVKKKVIEKKIIKKVEIKKEIPKKTVKKKQIVKLKVQIIQAKKEKTIKETKPATLTTEKLYANIKKQIYTNIKGIKYNSAIISTKIKLTILKDGSLEQLVFVRGDKIYFNNIQNAINKIFPVQIEDGLREKFPRYFRMEIVPSLNNYKNK